MKIFIRPETPAFQDFVTRELVILKPTDLDGCSITLGDWMNLTGGTWVLVWPTTLQIAFHIKRADLQFFYDKDTVDPALQQAFDKAPKSIEGEN